MLKDVTLVLGPVIFYGFEIPENIFFEDTQRIASHDLLGGTRIFDVMGPLPSDIRWSGIFSGESASSRAQLLDQILVQGTAIQLIWGSFTFTVVIRSFRTTFHNIGWIPYQISVAVLQDNTWPSMANVSSLAVDALSDASMATTFSALGGIVLENLTTAVSASGAVTLGTSAYNAANQVVSTAVSDTTSSFNAADSSIGQLSGLGVNSAADVATMIAAAENQAASNWAGVFLARLSSNMSRAGT